MKPHALLLVVWWLWFVPAVMVLLLPLKWWFALLVRGGEAVSSSGVDGDGVAILGVSALPFIIGIVPFLLLSLLYGFLFWRHRERGVALSARFWVPVYGAAFIVALGGAMALVTLAREQREYRKQGLIFAEELERRLRTELLSPSRADELVGARGEGLNLEASHSTPSMTLRYMHLAPSAPREAIGLRDDVGQRGAGRVLS